MEEFQVGDRVRRVDGYDDPHLGMYKGRIYVVKRVSPIGGTIAVEGSTGQWMTRFFEKVDTPESRRRQLAQAVKDKMAAFNEAIREAKNADLKVALTAESDLQYGVSITYEKTIKEEY